VTRRVIADGTRVAASGGAAAASGPGAAGSAGLDVHAGGAGEPLALVHGVGTSRGIWQRVLGPLAAERRVLSLDVPGFGTSAAIGAGFELAAVADRLAAALRAAAGEPYDLLGHSLGGALALTLAARHPQDVRRLVLVAPAGLAPLPAPVASVAGLLAGQIVPWRRRLGRPLAATAWGRWVLFGAVVADPAALRPQDARAMLDASAGATRIGPAVATAAAADLRPLLAGLTVPLGALWGTEDRVLSAEGVTVIERLRPDAAIVRLERTGHIPQVERPAAFLAALAEVLARTGAPARV